MAASNLIAAYLQREMISHSRKVCSLYRRMIRDIELHDHAYGEDEPFMKQIEILLVRKEFERYKDIKDMRKAKAILAEGEQLYWKYREEQAQEFPDQAINKPLAKDGIAYDRNLLSPDYVMDSYDPLEKAQYPHYYANREKMKDDYIRMWKKKVMNIPADQDLDTSQRS